MTSSSPGRRINLPRIVPSIAAAQQAARRRAERGGDSVTSGPPPPRQMGWVSVKNGELLALAAQGFDLFVTVEGNLSFQQNRAAPTIAIVIRRARSNRLADLKLLMPELLAAIASTKPGPSTIVGLQ